MICTDEMPDFVRRESLLLLLWLSCGSDIPHQDTWNETCIEPADTFLLEDGDIADKNGGEKRICTTSDHWKSYIRLILQEKTGMLLDMKQSLGTY